MDYFLPEISPGTLWYRSSDFRTTRKLLCFGTAGGNQENNVRNPDFLPRDLCNTNASGPEPCNDVRFLGFGDADWGGGKSKEIFHDAVMAFVYVTYWHLGTPGFDLSVWQLVFCADISVNDL